MNAKSILESRALGSVAVGLATLLAAVGVQQAASQASETVVLAPLLIAIAFAAIALLAGRAASGWRRTPYW